MTAASVPASPASKSYRYLVVIVLAVVYTFNFMDRQIMSILQEPIRKELSLSDTQLGMLTGLAFATLLHDLRRAAGWAADRYKRVWIMAASCAVWSLFTALCGVATNFVQLALSRVVVGIGEAGGSPPSYSLISDYFPPKGERRGGASAWPSIRSACRSARWSARASGARSRRPTAGGSPSSPSACPACCWPW